MRRKKKLDETSASLFTTVSANHELLRLLAAPFEVQCAAFPKDECPPDEIADEIDYNVMSLRI